MITIKPNSNSPRSVRSMRMNDNQIRVRPLPMLLSKKLKYVLITVLRAGPHICSAITTRIMKVKNIKDYKRKKPLNLGCKYAILIRPDINSIKQAIKLVILMARSLQQAVLTFTMNPSKLVFSSSLTFLLLFLVLVSLSASSS
jgi:hypothetical protein